MRFLKDIKQAFQEGYNESVRENEREEKTSYFNRST